MSNKVIMPKELTPECENCHCKGNSSCGHEPLDKDWNCALKPNGLCPCCDLRDKQDKPLKESLSPSPTVTPERLAEILSECCYKSRLMEKDSAADFRFEYFRKSIASELIKTLDIREKGNLKPAG